MVQRLQALSPPWPAPDSLNDSGGGVGMLAQTHLCQHPDREPKVSPLGLGPAALKHPPRNRGNIGIERNEEFGVVFVPLLPLAIPPRIIEHATHNIGDRGFTADLR